MASRLVNISATGKVVDGPLFLKSIVVTGGSNLASVAVEDSTAGGGTTLIALASAAGTSAAWHSADRRGVFFSKAIYATVSGASPSASFEYEK
jgi:hypothetical protein